MAYVEVQNTQCCGLALTLRPGTSAISPAIRRSGRLWWKKEERGYALQVVERFFDHCGGYVDSHEAWVCKGFFPSRSDAEQYRDDLLNDGRRALESEAGK